MEKAVAVPREQVVFFDLGGVLLQEAEINLHRAKSELLQQSLKEVVPAVKIFPSLFQFASLFCGSECQDLWFLGKISGEELVGAIEENIDKPEYANFFHNQKVKMLIKHSMRFILLPEFNVDLTIPFEEGVTFINFCKKSNLEMGIISNWDPISFPIIKGRFPQIFDLFEDKNMVIPQMVGHVKPSLEIYEFSHNRFSDVAKEQCFFVDDNLKNIEAARSYGIKAVHHRNWSQTEQELVEQGLKLKKNRGKFFVKTKKVIVIDNLIVNKKNKTVLIQQRSGTRKLFPYCWDFVGGHLENNESVEECIRRELFEEVHMQLVSVIGQIHEFAWMHDNYEVIDKIFIIEAKGKVQLEEGKAIAVKWITKNEAKLLLNPGERNNDMYRAALKAFGLLDKGLL